MTIERSKLNAIGGWVAMGIMAQVTAMMYIVAYVSIPKENLQLFNQICTSLLAIDLMMVSFFYGTTVNSQTKDSTLATLAETAQTAGKALAQPTADSLTVQAGHSATIDAGNSDAIVTATT